MYLKFSTAECYQKRLNGRRVLRASRCRCRIPFRSVLQSPPTSDQEDPDASVLLSRTLRLATAGRALDLRVQLASFRIFTCGLLVTCAVELVFEWHWIGADHLLVLRSFQSVFKVGALYSLRIVM